MQTVALRFRDLVTPQGRTLREHQELARRKKYTWWGWWRRPYERVPQQFLLAIAERCPVTIYLVDTGGSGQGFHLYPAMLEDIAVTPTGSDVPSPDVSATPTYYNSLRLAVWFKLTSIELSEIREPKLMKVVSLPTWPAPGDPDLSAYEGRLIESQEQLRRLDVTLWHIDIEV